MNANELIAEEVNLKTTNLMHRMAAEWVLTVLKKRDSTLADSSGNAYDGAGNMAISYRCGRPVAQIGAARIVVVG